MSDTQNAGGLLPCPFCGKPAQFRTALWISDGDVDAIIHAEATACPLSDFRDGSHDGSLVARWNTRATPQAEWRDISEAPKDGTRVVYTDRLGRLGRCVFLRANTPDEVDCWWDDDRGDEAYPLFWIADLPTPPASKEG